MRAHVSRTDKGSDPFTQIARFDTTNRAIEASPYV